MRETKKNIEISRILLYRLKSRQRKRSGRGPVSGSAVA